MTDRANDYAERRALLARAHAVGDGSDTLRRLLADVPLAKLEVTVRAMERNFAQGPAGKLGRPIRVVVVSGPTLHSHVRHFKLQAREFLARFSSFSAQSLLRKAGGTIMKRRLIML